MKLRIIQICILPTGKYGWETWTQNKNISKCIYAFAYVCQNYPHVYACQINALGNDYEYHGLNTEQSNSYRGWTRSHVWNTPELYIKKQKVSNFGHIKRHETLEKWIEGKVQGQRNMGRPHRSGEKNVEDWMGQVFGEWDEQQQIGWCI